MSVIPLLAKPYGAKEFSWDQLLADDNDNDLSGGSELDF